MKSLSLLLLVALLFSCGEDVVIEENQDNEVTEPLDSILLLKEIRVDGALKNEYTYNSDGTLASETNYSDDGPFIHTTYTYSETEIIKQGVYASSNDVAYTNKFKLVSDSLVSFEAYHGVDELGWTQYSSFDNDPCGPFRVTVRNPDEILIYNATTEYIDENCSYITRRLDGSNPGVEYVETEILRNDKYAATNSLKLPTERVEKRTSIEVFSRYQSNGSLNGNISYETEKVYNELNFPVTETRTYGNGNILVFTYVYY